MQTFHPVAAHFAVVLPLVALVFQVLFLFFRHGIYARSATVIFTVATLMVGFAYLSGGHDAKETVGEILSMYDAQGMELLKAHAGLGLNLLIAMGVVWVLNLASYKYSAKLMHYTVLAGMVAVTLGMFAQGKLGGEVVYQHGTVFEAHAIKDTLNTALQESQEATDDTQKVEILSEAIHDALGDVAQE
ncbi:MAG: hypothetical protein KU37_04950 [Sulfuricurvum sp. PC08-66]|nr:MAG: hypothetical protein KU37_04950 [Sulfuricurvum sp. PC08-66]